VEKHVKEKKKESVEFQSLKTECEKAKGSKKENARRKLYTFSLKQYTDYVRASKDLLLEVNTLKRLYEKDVIAVVSKVEAEEPVKPGREVPTHVDVGIIVDRAAVHDKIGAHVTEKMSAWALQHAPGSIVSIFPEFAGFLSEKALQGLGKLVGSKPFTMTLEATATGLELTRAFPSTVSWARQGLIKAGLPIKQIDEMLRKAPQKTIELGLAVLNPIIEYPAAAATYLKEKALWLLSIQEDQRLAKTLHEAGITTKKAASSFIQAHEKLSKTLVSFCDPKRAADFVCSSQVRLFLQHPKAMKDLEIAMQALAKKNVDGASQFKDVSQLWEYMGEYGQVPKVAQEAASTIQRLYETSSVAPSYSFTLAEQCYATAEQLKKTITEPAFTKLVEVQPPEQAKVIQELAEETTGFFAWFSEKFQQATSYVQDTSVGRAVTAAAEGVRDVTAPLVEPLVEKAGQAVQTTKDMAGKAAVVVQDLAERAVGVKQALPGAILPGVEQLQKLEAALKEAQKNELLAAEAAERLVKLSNHWYGALVQYAVTNNEAATKEALTYYTENIAPLIQKSAKIARGLCKMAEANKEVLNAQVAIEEYTKPFQEHYEALGALESLATETTSTAATAMGYAKGGLAFVSPFLALATTVGETGFAIPALMHRIIPAGLRQAASYAPEVRAQLNSWAQSARALGIKGGTFVDRYTTQTIGAALYTNVFMET
ncbi:MAG TPA: hypothetical protein VN457_05120, partial [Chlamydiales bacterium]|nr:hypothetical protein [Chlamydiales bacterium]